MTDDQPELTAGGPALFRYPEYDEGTRKLNHDVPGIVVTVLHPYAYDMGSGQPHHVVRTPAESSWHGEEMAVRTDQLTPLDADVLDACTTGFVRAWLWTDAQPVPTYTATFAPEAWSNNYAISVDPEGPTEWDCTVFVNLSDHLDYLTRCADGQREDLGEDDGVLDTYDVFKLDPDAPEWVRAWSGPFAIHVKRDDGETGGLENHEPTPELRETARTFCAQFLVTADPEDIAAHMEAYGDPDGGHPGEYIGHTFYLDAAGHGVSFTDRAWRDDDPMTAVCKRLSDVAKTFPGVEHAYAYELADGTVGI